MMLQPRKFKYKNFQKHRVIIKPRYSTLKKGLLGIRLLRNMRISAKRIFRLKLFLKRASKKSDITKRKV